MPASLASVPTENAAKYVAQLCRHWEHSLAVTATPGRGEIVFPRDARGADWPGDGRAVLSAEGTALAVRVEGSTDAHLAALRDTVARHLDRFAFREAPLAFRWSPA